MRSAFESWLLDTRSAHTRRARMEVWGRFLRFAYPGAQFEDALQRFLSVGKGEAVRLASAYKAHLITQGRAITTVNHAVAILRSFVKHLYRAGVVDWTLDALEPERQHTTAATRMSKRLPAQSEARLLSLLKTFAPKGTGAKALRDAVALQLMAWHGLRASEVVGLSFEHIQDGTCTIHGKGNKLRQIQLRKDTLHLLRRLRDAYTAEGIELKADEHGTPVIASLTNGKGERITYDGIRQIVKGALQAKGISQRGIACHSLRHAFATIAVRHSDLLSVAAQLGHANIATTQAYLHTLKTPTVAKALPIGRGR